MIQKLHITETRIYMHGILCQVKPCSLLICKLVPLPLPLPTARFWGRGNNQAASNNNASGNPQEDWLKGDQLTYFEVLKSRKEKRDKGRSL
jgi:hypothetical protein